MTGKIEEDIKEIDDKVTRLRTEVEGMDTKIQLNKLKSELLDAKTIRLTEEG